MNKFFKELLIVMGMSIIILLFLTAPLIMIGIVN